MKRSMKRTLSVLLAVVMVLSSLPFTAISAFAEEDMSAELQTAISDYEEVMTKMTTDNKIYKNLTAAYDSYVKANRYVDAYKYGNKAITASEFSAMTTELRTNTAAMTEWSAQKGEYKQGFSTADTVPDVTANNSINILYTTQTTGQTGNTSTAGDIERKIYYSSAVLLYDGITKPRMPVMLSAQQTQSSRSRTRYLYAAYPVSSDVTNAQSMEAAIDHEDIILIGGWRGWDGTNRGATLDWGWNFQLSGSPTAYTAGAGFAGIDKNGTNGKQTTSTRSAKLPTATPGIKKDLVMFSNALQLTDRFAFNEGEYSRDISTNWYVSSSDTPNSGQDAGIIVPTATIKVLNYKALIDALTGTKKAIFADFKSYKQGGLKAYCSAFDTATKVDISDTTTDNVAVKAQLIELAVNGINNATEPTKDAAGYASLRTALDNTAKVYAAGNTNNANYTAETWGPFETAVLAAQSRMANLYSNAYSISDAALAEKEAKTLTDAFDALVLNKVPVDTTSLDIIMYNAHVIAKNANFFTAESMAASNIVELTRQAKIAIWQEEDNYPLEAQKIAESPEAQAIVASYVTSLSAAIRLCVLDYDANIAQIGYSLTGAVAKGQSFAATKDDYGNYAILDEAVKQGVAFMAKDNSIDPEVANNALNVITAYATSASNIIKAVNGLKPSFAKISNGTIANEGYTATTKIDSSRQPGKWTLTWNRSDQVIFFKTVREQSVFELPVSNMSFYNDYNFDAMIDSINLNSATDVATGELTADSSVSTSLIAEAFGGKASYPGKTAIKSGNLELKLAGIKAASSSGSAIAKDMAGNDITDINTDLTPLLETTEGSKPISGGILAKNGTTELACKTTITAPQVTGSINEESIPSAKSCVFDISQSALTMGMFYYYKYHPFLVYAGWAYDTAKYTETIYVVDISTLLDLIKECEALTDKSADYSTTSWNNFIGALSGAKAEMPYAGMTYSEIVGECDKRYTALWNARKALAAPASNKALSEAIAAAKDAYQNDESKVKPSTWNDFKVAYQNAMSDYLGKYSDENIRQYDKTDATVIAEINKLVTALNTAKNNLIYKIDFTADEFNVDGAVASLVASITNETYTATSVQAVANAITKLTYYNMSALDRASHYMDEADVVAAVKAEVIAISQLASQLVEGTVDATALEYAKAEGKSKLSDPDAYDQNEIAEKLAALSEFVDVSVAGATVSAFKYDTQEQLDADVTYALSNISIQKYAVYIDGVEEDVYDYGTQITVKSPTNAQVDWYYASASTTSTTANKYFTTSDEVTFIVKGETHLVTKKASETETVKVTYVNSINMKNVDVQYVEPGTQITLSVANAPSVVFYTCNGVQINGASYNDGDTYEVNENVVVLYTYNRTVTQSYSLYVADIGYRYSASDVTVTNLNYNDRIEFAGAEYGGNDMVYHVNDTVQINEYCGRALEMGNPPVYAWVEVNAPDIQAWRDAAASENGIINFQNEFSEMAYNTNGKVVAYGPDYTFRIHKDTTLLALDEEGYRLAVEQGVVTDPGDDNGAKVETEDTLVITDGVKFSIISNFTVPENCEMVETGILFVANKNSSEIPTVELTLGNAGTNGILRVKSTSHTPGKQYVISINTPTLAGKKVGDVGMKWVAYMTYTDKDGNMITVYSDPTSPTNTTDSF